MRSSFLGNTPISREPLVKFNEIWRENTLGISNWRIEKKTLAEEILYIPVNRASVAQFVEHRAVTREVVSSTPARSNTQDL